MEMEAEGIVEHRSSFAAPSIFFIVIAFQFLAKWLENLKKVRLFPSFSLFRLNLFHVYIIHSVCVSIPSLSSIVEFFEAYLKFLCSAFQFFVDRLKNAM